MAWEIAVVWLTIVVTGLVTYVFWVLRDARRILKETEQTVASMRQEITERSEDTAKLMRSVQRLTEDVQVRVDRTEDFFEGIAQCGRSAKQLGGSLSNVASAFTDTASHVRHAVHTQQARIAEIGEWVGIGWQIWQKWQAERTESSDMKGTSPGKGEDQHARKTNER
jgi:uncharacterized protein YoxC